MKRLIAICLFLVSCLCMNGFITAPTAQTTVVDAEIQPQAELVENTKIEHILNINNIYGEEFLDNEQLVNKAAVSLRSHADGEGFIPEAIVTAYIKDLYDIDIDCFDNINVNLPKKEGYVLLIPRGYTTYSHSVISVTEGDGYLTVKSNVVCNYHDGGSDNGIATTVLTVNENSSFGYNIIDSYITYNTAAVTSI